MEAEREHGREVQVLVFVSSSAMDSSASFTRQRFRPPFPNPRARGGRGEVGDSRRLLPRPIAARERRSTGTRKKMSKEWVAAELSGSAWWRRVKRREGRPLYKQPEAELG